ncbi:MAG: glycosyltransferase, partial [Lachnospiraceae bacterium]|nr:glycosyltransferase [Lachnospiraceae bacterium]
MSKINFMKKDNLTQEGAAFTYFIELINREGDDIVMRGWVYSANDEPVDVTLLREDKTNLEAGRIWRKTRRDVKKEFELDNDYKAEFLIRFKRDDIKDDTIYLKFSPDGVSSDSEPMLVAINMSGLDYSFTTGGRFAQFLTDQPVKRGLRLLGKGNPVGIYHKLRAKIKGTEDAYTIWRRVNCPGPDDYEKQRKAEFEYNPLISISIPLYNTPLEFFTALMDSIMGQTYGNFQLCLADGSDTDALGKYIDEHYKDERIDYVHLDKNLGIAGNTNKALEMARGEFVMLTDHDDILDIAALYEIVNVLNNDSSTDIIYTDE